MGTVPREEERVKSQGPRIDADQRGSRHVPRQEARARGGARRAPGTRGFMALPDDGGSHSERRNSQIERNIHSLLVGFVPGVLCRYRPAGIPAVLQCR